jgi:hypothetical protein
MRKTNRQVMTTLVAALLMGWSSAALAQQLPIADPGPEQVVPCEDTDGAEVTLDGLASFDPDGPATLTYTWSSPFLGATTLDGAIQVLTLPAGTFLFTLVVDDGIDGASLPVDVQVTVGDGSPPTITLSTDAFELWPPNHKYHVLDAADLVDSVVDACGGEVPAQNVSFEQVTSDEPDNANGDGNTIDDILFAYGCSSVLLRAERQGGGDGRVYQALLGAGDASGNPGQALVTVSVPKSRGVAKEAVDSGDVLVVEASPETCLTVDLCPPEPALDCVESSERASLLLTSRSGGERLRFSARGFPVDSLDLGEGDAGTDYQLCLYVEDAVSTSLESEPAAPAGEGWKSSGKGQSFRAKAKGVARGAGMKQLALRSSGTGTKVKAKGEGLTLPQLPIADGSVVIVQLHGSDGSCLETWFDREPKANTETRYKARQ